MAALVGEAGWETPLKEKGMAFLHPHYVYISIFKIAQGESEGVSPRSVQLGDATSPMAQFPYL